MFEFRKNSLKIQFKNGLIVAINCGPSHYSPNYNGEQEAREFIELSSVEIEIYGGWLFHKHINPSIFSKDLELHNIGFTKSVVAGYVKPDKVAEILYNVSRLSKEDVERIAKEDNKEEV